MKKSVIFCFFMSLLFPFVAHAQLSGTALLSGQANHSNIKVKFISTGGTAVTDSAYTTATGSYSINITGGAYKIVFSKAGYLDYNYNGGATIVLTNTVSLTSVTLLPGTQLNVSGNVSGSWTNNYTYIVTGDIIVPLGQSLTIQEGTPIKFNGSYSVTANGTLTAAGTSTAPILFTSNLPSPAPGDWNRIVVNSSESFFSNCILEYSTYGFELNNCHPYITGNEIRNFNGTGIYGNNASAFISKNHIHDFNSSIYAQGITFDGYSNYMTVECNEIHDGGGYGIRPFSAAMVRNNVIYNINGVSRGIGMDFGGGCVAQIENNYIHDCNIGMQDGETIMPAPYPKIINNTIVNNVYGGLVLNEFYANADIINNIISNNGYGIGQSSPSCSTCGTTPNVVANNLVWNNANGDYSGVQVAGIGQIVSTNAQGNPVDSYFNLSQDPLFVSASSPSLTAGSPCFGAGMSSYSQNIGFNPAYSCVNVVQSVKALQKPDLLCSLFPNPNNGTFVLKIDNDIKNAEVLIVNSVGQEIHKQQVLQGINNLSLSGVAGGVYFYTLFENKQPVKNGKLVIN